LTPRDQARAGRRQQGLRRREAIGLLLEAASPRSRRPASPGSAPLAPSDSTSRLSARHAPGPYHALALHHARRPRRRRFGGKRQRSRWRGRLEARMPPNHRQAAEARSRCHPVLDGLVAGAPAAGYSTRRVESLRRGAQGLTKVPRSGRSCRRSSVAANDRPCPQYLPMAQGLRERPHSLRRRRAGVGRHDRHTAPLHQRACAAGVAKG
jgi:hypothetical protein